MSASRLSLRITRPAARDIQDIRRFTRTRWGPEQADAYHAALRDAMFSLCDHPQLGRERDDIVLGLRSFRVLSHTIFYLVRGNDLVVQRILHGRMDYASEQVP